MTWTTTEVCKMTGATYRQLDYWCRTNRIPDQPAPGSGGRRRWTRAQIDHVDVLLRASEWVNANLDQAVAKLKGTG